MAGIGSVVMDAMGIERQRREAEKKARIRRDGTDPCALRRRQVNRHRRGHGGAWLAVHNILFLFNAQRVLLVDIVADRDECEWTAASRFQGDIADNPLASGRLPDDERLVEADAGAGKHAAR